MEINKELSDAQTYEMFKKDIQSSMSLEEFVVASRHFQKIKELHSWYDYNNLKRSVVDEVMNEQPRPYCSDNRVC